MTDSNKAICHEYCKPCEWYGLCPHSYEEFDAEREHGSYWKQVTDIYNRQKEKGIETYGQTLEKNKKPGLMERLGMLEEELVDALVYIQWIKEKIGGD